MQRLWLILGFIEIAFMIFAFVDVLLTPNWRVRGVPKVVWVFIVLLLSPIGAILWFVIGKEKVDSAQAPPVRREVHPDDDPEFLARMRVKKDQDERIARLEQELADLDDDQPEKPNGSADK
jgi:hypothetical protein